MASDPWPLSPRNKPLSGHVPAVHDATCFTDPKALSGCAQGSTPLAGAPRRERTSRPERSAAVTRPSSKERHALGVQPEATVWFDFLLQAIVACNNFTVETTSSVIKLVTSEEKQMTVC